MRSSKGMYALAKAKAIEEGLTRARNTNQTLIGFGLTYEQIERIYAREGFMVRKNKIKSGLIDDHIANWKLAQLVIVVNDLVFFLLDEDDLEDMHVYSYLNTYKNEHPDIDATYIGLRGVMEAAE